VGSSGLAIRSELELHVAVVGVGAVAIVEEWPGCKVYWRGAGDWREEAGIGDAGFETVAVEPAVDQHSSVSWTSVGPSDAAAVYWETWSSMTGKWISLKGLVFISDQWRKS